MKSRESIAIECKKVSDMIRADKEWVCMYPHLVNTFEMYHDRLISNENETEGQNTIREMLQMFSRGMGGIYDMCLMQNGKLLPNETKRLQQHFDAIYELCLRELS